MNNVNPYLLDTSFLASALKEADPDQWLLYIRLVKYQNDLFSEKRKKALKNLLPEINKAEKEAPSQHKAHLAQLKKTLTDGGKNLASVHQALLVTLERLRPVQNRMEKLADAGEKLEARRDEACRKLKRKINESREAASLRLQKAKEEAERILLEANTKSRK